MRAARSGLKIVLEVSRRAGHSKGSFTLDRYGHPFPSADADLA